MAKTFGAKAINISAEHISLNTKDGDSNPCDHCHQSIRRLMVKREIDRRNRIDCEDGHRLVSYHLVCYDTLVVGKVTRTTERTLAKLKELYGHDA